MKNKIGYLIIGILLGSIITTSIFLVQIKEINNNSNEQIMDRKDKMMQEPNGEMGEPPERPDEDGQEQPPEMPDEKNNTQNSRVQPQENLTTENKI